MAVLRPLKVVIENYPEDQVEEMEAINNPEDPSMGTRKIPFSRELYIEQDDFLEDPPKKFFRLAPGREVRSAVGLYHQVRGRGQGLPTGEVVELRCTYDPESRSGTGNCQPQSERHAALGVGRHAHVREVRLFDHLFREMDPEDVPEGQDWHEQSESPTRWKCWPSATWNPACARPSQASIFNSSDWATSWPIAVDSQPGRPVFNRSVPLRDTWAKIQQKGGA